MLTYDAVTVFLLPHASSFVSFVRITLFFMPHFLIYSISFSNFDHVCLCMRLVNYHPYILNEWIFI